MARKALKPVTIAGIEFDALIDEQKTFSATIPSYPVDEGFPVSDTIILDPLTVQMTLYVTNTPVTWLHRHGSSADRVNKICDQIEELWLSKKLVKIVTTDKIYTDMGLTSISINKSKEIGYAREITIQAQKVITTKTKTVRIPDYLLKSGETEANAGSAATNNTSSKDSVSGTGSGTTTETETKEAKSALYGIASEQGYL